MVPNRRFVQFKHIIAGRRTSLRPLQSVKSTSTPRRRVRHRRGFRIRCGSFRLSQSSGEVESSFTGFAFGRSIVRPFLRIASAITGIIAERRRPAVAIMQCRKRVDDFIPPNHQPICDARCVGIVSPSLFKRFQRLMVSPGMQAESLPRTFRRWYSSRNGDDVGRTADVWLPDGLAWLTFGIMPGASDLAPLMG